MVPNPVPTFAVAAEICLMVINDWAAAGVVFLCAVSARLFLSARYCNMAIGLALVALGHDVLTMENFAILRLMVVYEPFEYQSIGYFWCSHVDSERPIFLAILYGYFLQAICRNSTLLFSWGFWACSSARAFCCFLMSIQFVITL
jgi:hypothetical protein